MTNSNVAMMSSDINGGSDKTKAWTAVWAAFDEQGYAQNMRTDYLTPFIDGKFP